MFNESLSSGQLPPTLRQAAITLLPKSLSLLNVDYKILSKVLAARLETVISQIIATAQTGFILNRHSSSNFRKLFNIVCSPPSRTSEMVISLDAEKAFDLVEWEYLFAALKKWSLRIPQVLFISWIKLLYSHPTATVITNGQSEVHVKAAVCPLYFWLLPLSLWP